MKAHTLFSPYRFITERHREALLWSWLVARWGTYSKSTSDTLDSATRDALWTQLALIPERARQSSLSVGLPYRAPVDERVWEKAGLEVPKATNYSFGMFFCEASVMIPCLEGPISPIFF
jgi:hypothetical protein